MFETEQDYPGVQRTYAVPKTGKNTPADRLPSYDEDTQEIADAAKGVESDALDSAKARELHRVMLGHYYRELDRQGAQRELMARDEAFFDHDQWSAKEIEILEGRGQVPLVFNVINTAVNWVLGSEARAPMDYSILPRRKEGLTHAERKTELMKHLTDINHSQHHYSRAFKEVVSAGLSWLETGQNADDFSEPVYDRMESWRNVIWDSTAMEPDFSDGRYLFRNKWTDVDLAVAKFPHRATMIRQSASTIYESGTTLDGAGDDAMDSIEDSHFEGGASVFRSGGAWGQRDRVRLFEGWFRMPAKGKFIKGGDFSGEIFDEYSEGHVRDVNEGRASIVERTRDRIFVAIFTVRGLLHVQPSPYRHNRYPLTPIWGRRRASDGMPYGLIRGLVDINRDLNKRASKSLHILSTARVFLEEGAVDDVDELRDEAARPDAVIVYKKGYAAPQVVTDQNLANAHSDLMSRDIQMVQQVSGVTDENMGRKTNATSGKAILARQDQGALATSFFFENFRYARMIHGEKLLSNVEQFYTETKKFRITNSRGNPEYVSINDPETEDDDWINTTKADFIVSEEDWRQTYRQAQAEMLLDLAQKLAATAPELVIGILDLLVEAMDVPKRDELVKRIRQITGTQDPDADPNNPDPEQLAMEAEKQKQAELAERMALAEVADKEAGAAEKFARAAKTEGEVRIAERATVSSELDNLKKAIETAVALIGVQGVAAVADEVMRTAETRAVMPPGAGAEAAAMPPQAMLPPPPAQPPMPGPVPAPQPAMQGAM